MHAVTGYLTEPELKAVESRYQRFEHLRANPDQRPKCKECGCKLNYQNESGYCGQHRHLRPIEEAPYEQTSAGPGHRKAQKVYLNCHKCGAGFERLAKEHRAKLKKGRTKFFCSPSCGASHNRSKEGRNG